MKIKRDKRAKGKGRIVTGGYGVFWNKGNGGDKRKRLTVYVWMPWLKIRLIGKLAGKVVDRIVGGSNAIPR